VAGWDNDYLYLGIRVKDEKYVQEGAEEKIYLGDSIEILFDRYVSYDYYLQAMTSDDYQIGISPGKGAIGCFISTGKVASLVTTSNPPEAYKWFPKTEAGKVTVMKVVADKSSQGYQVEMKIPWSVLGVTNPSTGDHFGFAISISDNDIPGTLNQQTVVSNVPGRFYANPTNSSKKKKSGTEFCSAFFIPSAEFNPDMPAIFPGYGGSLACARPGLLSGGFSPWLLPSFFQLRLMSRFCRQ
jgi:hypothetical protein